MRGLGLFLALSIGQALATGCDGPVAIPSNPVAVRLEWPRPRVTAGDAMSMIITVVGVEPGDEVVLNLADAPEGVTASFIPDEFTPFMWTMILRTDAATVPGDYWLTVRATASETSGEGAMLLTVDPTIPTFYLDLSPGQLVIRPGDSAQAIVTVTRHVFDGEVQFDITDLPPGVEWTTVPDTAVEGTYTLTLHVGAEVPPGSYGPTLWGTSSVGARFVVFSLLVEASNPYFAVTLSQARVDLLPGEGTDVVVTVTRAPGYTEPVVLSINQGPPLGWLQREFIPNPVADTTATLRLTRSGGPGMQAYMWWLTVVGISPAGSSSTRLMVWYDY